MYVLQSRIGRSVGLYFFLVLMMFSWSEVEAADKLAAGQSLYKGQSLYSPNGQYRLILQEDNNLVVYDHGRAIWSTRTNDLPVHRLIMQSDSNLVIYSQADVPLWHTHTHTHAQDVGVSAYMQNDGNFVVYTSEGVPIWDSKGFVQGAPASPPPTDSGRINFARFYDGFRRNYGALTQSQVNGIDVLLTKMQSDTRPAINDRVVWTRQLAYLFATIKHEVANTYLPITEFSNSTCRRYDGGCRYKGRGYVQLTHRYNYRTLSEVVGVDLVASPEKALEPNIAYTVMSHGMFYGLFTSRKLGSYIRTGITDYVNARRVVNGTDKANLIKKYAQTFQGILEGST